MPLIPNTRLREDTQDATYHVCDLRHLRLVARDRADVEMRLAIAVDELYQQELEQLVHSHCVEMLRTDIGHVELRLDLLEATEPAVADQLLQVKMPNVEMADLSRTSALYHAYGRCGIGLEVDRQVDIKLFVDALHSERLVHNRSAAMEFGFSTRGANCTLASAIHTLDTAPHSQSSARR